MYYFLILLAVALSVALVFSVFQRGNFGTWSKAYRIVIIGLGITFFTYYFIQKSTVQTAENSMTIQVINKLPFPLDFYLVKINSSNNETPAYEPQHLGSIRNDFYRLEYLDITAVNEFWIAGYVGKKNLAYFSQHKVLNKNEDQIIEVQNYKIDSERFSEIAKKEIEILKFHKIKTAIWITLDFLLLFLNLGILLRKAGKKIPASFAGIS